MPLLLEICVDSPAGCRAAELGGAQRIELCAALDVGGLTPGPGLLDSARAATALPIVVLTRPRRGDFLYDDGEFAALARDVDAAKEAGAAAVALGLLARDGTVDIARTRVLIERARPMEVTFHRAFDLTREPYEALDALLELGVDRLLTSGCAPDAWTGRATIAELRRRAGERLEVMAGGGVRSTNAAELARLTGVRELHSSAGARMRSAMDFVREDCALGGTGQLGEYELRKTDEDEVRAIVAAMVSD